MHDTCAYAYVRVWPAAPTCVALSLKRPKCGSEVSAVASTLKAGPLADSWTEVEANVTAPDTREAGQSADSDTMGARWLPCG